MTLDDDIAGVPIVLRVIALLVTLLGAPLRAWRRFVDADAAQRFLLEKTLQAFGRRGYRLRYAGEDERVAELRLAMIERFLADPRGFMRHEARRWRGSGGRPERMLDFAPPRARPADAVIAGANAPAPCVFNTS